MNDESRPKAWSKYSKELATPKNGTKKVKEEPKKKTTIVDSLLGDLKDDEGFKEFVAASKAINDKRGVLNNDIDFNGKNEPLIKQKKTTTKKKETEALKFESESSDDSEDCFDVARNEEKKKKKKKKEVKTKKPNSTNNTDDEDDEEEEEEVEVEQEVKKETENKKKSAKNEEEEEEADFENGRLFLRNLCYTCKEEELEALFKPYAPLVEVAMPIDGFSKRPKGFAYITCMFPEKALKAYNDLDGTIFQGRMLHIMPAKSKKEEDENNGNGASFKGKKEAEQKKKAQSSHNWNSLFISQDAVANLMASRYNVNKSDLYDVHGVGKKSSSVAVKLAVGETQLVNDMRKFLVRNGVKLEAFSGGGDTAQQERSKTTILIKNLPNNSTESELRALFVKYNVNGIVKRLVMPEYGVAALVEFQERQEARDAFKKLAYRPFKSVPIYLEWAPVDVFDADPAEREKVMQEDTDAAAAVAAEKKVDKKVETEKMDEEEKDNNDEDGYFDECEPESTLFVKNLNFDTNEQSLQRLFAKVARCRAMIARKIAPNKETLSMGYGFVQFKKASHAREAIKTLQNHS